VTKLRRLPAIREQDVLRTVKHYLELRGFLIWRRNIGGAFRGMQFVRFSSPGQADLWGWERGTGKHIEVEIKRPNGRTSPQRQVQQQQWLDRAKRDGCIAFRAASVEECEERLAEFGYERRLLC
jgi:hypothetical protein